jgi:hypothetical protein
MQLARHRVDGGDSRTRGVRAQASIHLAHRLGGCELVALQEEGDVCIGTAARRKHGAAGSGGLSYDKKWSGRGLYINGHAPSTPVSHE